MREKWKPIDIEPFSKYYMVSSKGRILRKARKVITKNGKSLFFNERIVKQRLSSITPKMSAELYLTIDGTVYRKYIFVDNQVAKVFLKNKYSENESKLIHIDGDFTNNKVNNLKWVLKNKTQKINFFKKIKKTIKKIWEF